MNAKRCSMVMAAAGIVVLGVFLFSCTTTQVTPGSERTVRGSKPLINSDKNKVAIRGYDTVACFNQGRPLLGSKEFEYPWMGAIWRFSSAEHRDLFKSNPEKYAPQYGGY